MNHREILIEMLSKAPHVCKLKDYLERCDDKQAARQYVNSLFRKGVVRCGLNVNYLKLIILNDGQDLHRY